MDVQWVVLAVSAGAVASSLSAALRQYLLGRHATRISIKQGNRVVELDAKNVDQAEQIIEQFLARHPTENREAEK